MTNNDMLIDIGELAENDAKKVPVCICLDTELGMRIISDSALKQEAQRIYNEHKGDPIFKVNSNTISLDPILKNFYDEISPDILKKYGNEKAEVIKNIKEADLNPAKQATNILKAFFENLREKRQDDIEVEVCVITFSGGKTDVLIPLSGWKEWGSKEWFKNFLSKAEKDIKYKSPDKSLLIGLKKAIDILNERKKYYEDNQIDNVRGRIVLLTRDTPSNEEKIMDIVDKVDLESSVQESLKGFKHYPIILSDRKNDENVLCDLEFPGDSQFISAKNCDEKKLQEVFTALSASFSTGLVFEVPDAEEKEQNDDLV